MEPVKTADKSNVSVNDDEITAVIAAAIAAIESETGTKYIIKNIRSVTSPWVMSGRFSR